MISRVEAKKKGVWYIHEAFKRGRRRDTKFVLTFGRLLDDRKNPVVKMVVVCRLSQYNCSLRVAFS
jgi:hypothetical protein